MKFIILLTILGFAAGAASRDEVKGDFERFTIRQARLKDKYYPTYINRGLETFASIVQQNSIPVGEIINEKKALYNLPAEATVENNEELARIANRIADDSNVFDCITDDETLSSNLKFRALILAVQNPDNVNYPTAEDLKKGVNAVIDAEHPISGAVEPLYKTLYEMQGLNFVPSYLRIQAKMSIIRFYYKRPEVGLSKEIIARIDKILADNMEADSDVVKNFPIDTTDRAEMMIKVLPAYLKSYTDLFQELNLAQIECSYVRCRSTKNDLPVVSTEKPANKPTDKPTDKPADKPTEKPADKPTDEPTDDPTENPTDEPIDKPNDKQNSGPNSTLTRTSGSVTGIVCGIVFLIAFI